MSIIAWVFSGLISGLVASKVTDGSSQGSLKDMALGVLGAFVGGVMFHLVGQTSVTGLNMGSVLVSVIGAAAVLVAYHAVSGRRSPVGVAHDSQRMLTNGKRESR
jgi:uncharacterized membrane protein YeaQ/YmgE (transglycosylase-associated protein family)